MIGIGVSPGIGIGKAIIKKDTKIDLVKKHIAETEEEIQKLNTAREKAKNQIEELYEHAFNTIGKKEAGIFRAHRMILEDPDFFGQIEAKIREEKVNSEWAVWEVANIFINMFQAMEDDYMKERASDIKDVTGRLIRIILNVKEMKLSTLSQEVIIVAEDLTPSDTAQMDKNKVIGFITETGGKNSHSAIMARTLEIPAVVGVEKARTFISDGDYIILDGDTGEIVLNPNKDALEAYKQKKEAYIESTKKLQMVRGKKSITKDGFVVKIAANIGTPKDVEGVIDNDGEGVGLYRTEFLYMDRDKLPTEEEQFEAYKEVAIRLEGKPVVIRTLDIGGDKDLSYLKLPEEMNPFLGYRAIRLCLDRTDIFKTQLRALLRASVYGDIKIMFPMISAIEELRQAKGILEGVKEELRAENIKFNNNIEIGIMIEIPSAAVMSDLFAKEVDFFSIGTNDLIQYTTAVDRGNRKVSYLYNEFHPALLRLIKTIIDNGHKEGIKVKMCGEVAGNPKLIPILIGMGLDEFSMSASSMLRARWIVNNILKKDMEGLVEEILKLPTAQEVKEFIQKNIHI
ncbi:phosphotransferase system, enzyme I, PtsI [Proteiniborus ethanoligenes]|uniref:Phosphoenolpyruvate-protein phosphotransferase n=1 Tax=Proteiniborus ethanoligenes TaxID=415015 RepID=A0A1H3P7E4_9FIRM|nr:phosphoenolpyruvate--protein phosphotransferase [Proteiniborus ethanoligenes]TAH63195.1 MAG: phosphoenolpyruvate--protein phosphotransferase [Gottschalkiaceae bacterium]SDY96735.1 phosphotransferase system, enzyme I, PtsI [Proteiniborus ethanoligenes]